MTFYGIDTTTPVNVENGQATPNVHFAQHPRCNNHSQQYDGRNRSQFHVMFHLDSSHRDDGGR